MLAEYLCLKGLDVTLITDSKDADKYFENKSYKINIKLFTHKPIIKYRVNVLTKNKHNSDLFDNTVSNILFHGHFYCIYTHNYETTIDIKKYCKHHIHKPYFYFILFNKTSPNIDKYRSESMNDLSILLKCDNIVVSNISEKDILLERLDIDTTKILISPEQVFFGRIGDFIDGIYLSRSSDKIIHKHERSYLNRMTYILTKNDKYYHKLILCHAVKCGMKLIENKCVRNLAITGSIAKNNSWLGSDLDYIGISEACIEAEEFCFKKNVIENIHYISTSYAFDILNTKDIIELTALLHKDCVGDYFYNSIPLIKNNDTLNQVIDFINHFRISDAYLKQIDATYDELYNKYINKAIYEHKSKLPYEAALSLRKAVDFYSIKLMISKGWIIQGSKKRPEQLKRYCITNLEKDFYHFYININSLNNKKLCCIYDITDRRQKLRLKYQSILKRNYQHDNSNEYVRQQIKHNSYSYNYYIESIMNGYELGALYHIRNISGFQHYIHKYLLLDYNNAEYKYIDGLLTDKAIEKSIVQEWLYIMDLNIDITEDRIKQFIKITQSIDNCNLPASQTL